ncbi:MAG: hypothetical protein IT436_18255 [Phycisphaerales bacterium]|nr:hypothetical protein [Phycisphaerales bacterium]
MLTKKVQGWLGSPGAPAPQISLAAFGKHPGWDDHIEDLGLETEALIQARRVLYSEGLGGNIESGVWDNLEEHQRLAGFGHIVIWRRGWDLLIARIWSSSDGKGRTRYPMVLCVHCAGIPLTWAINEVLPRLEKAQTRCEETPRASDVREIVQATRLKLRTALTASIKDIGSWHGDDVVEDRELARLAESPQLQAFKGEPGGPPPPPRAGLLRILYQVEREMSAFAVGSGKERKSAMASARAQQIRVPSCGVAPGEAGRLWTGVLLETIADGVGIMTIQAVDQRWLDVIVGEPATANLFCMRASDKMIPLTSDVPYTLDADFIGRAQVMIDAWSGKVPKPKTAPTASAPPAPSPATDPPLPTSPPPRAMPLGVLLLVGLVLVVAAVITFLALRGSAGPNDGLIVPEAPSPPEARPAIPEPAPAPAPPSSGATPSRPQDIASIPITTPEVTIPQAEPAPKGEAPAAAGAEGAPPAAPDDSSTKPTPPPPPSAPPRPGGIVPTGPGGSETAITPPAPVTSAAVGRALAAGIGLDDPISPGGPTLSEAAARLDAAAGGFVVAGVQKLRTIKNLEKRDELETILRSASSQTAFEAFAAWRRLVELGWPDRREEFKAFPEARAKVLSLAEGVSDGVRRPALRGEFTASARRAVLAGLEVCGAATDAEWGEALAVAEGAGVSRADLGAVARFNTVLMEFRVDVMAAAAGAGRTDDAAARARVTAFLGQVEGLDPAVRMRAQTLVTALRAAMASPETQETQGTRGPDVARLGPGSAGWRLVAGATGEDRLVFEAPLGVAGPPGSPGAGAAGGPGPDRIEFARLPGGGAYLSRDEVSVGVALRVIQRRGAWGEVRKARLLRMFDPALNDPRPGPRSWDWSVRRTGEAELAGQWLWPGPEGARVRIVSEAPTDDVPLQHVSVDGMAYIAALLGCRLPTLDEWRRAVAGEQASGGSPNLRDASWKKQWDVVAAKKGQPDAPPWPDRGAFKPREMLIPIDERARPASAEDDGVVWFSAVGKGPGAVFRNLVGNVAEVVFEGPVPQGADAARAEQVDGLLGDRTGIRVVGGSALSAAELGVDRAWPVERTPSREGWADVGFRLAFAAPAGGSVTGGATGDVAGGGPGVWARASEAVSGGGYLGRE